MFALLSRVVFVFALTLCVAQTPAQAQGDAALLSNPIRTDNDRKADARRQPLELPQTNT